MSKVDIISGFLGAGKTTLIKKLINECFKNEKIVLIENEFGEIGIDGGFLKEAGIEITEMNSGCICCSLVGDFSKALVQVVDTYHPDRIIIEPSGVGKLSDVIKAVLETECDELELNHFVTVVDAKKCKIYSKNFGEFFNNQIEYASSIILSRSQDLELDQLQNVIQIIKEHNDEATIITTPWEDITGEAILNAFECVELIECGCGCDHDDHHDHHDEECCCGHHEHHEHHHDEECCCGHHEHHHHHADEVFISIGKETVNEYSLEQLEDIMTQLNDESAGTILRAKGIVKSNEGHWFHFDYVPGEYEVRVGAADYTGRICVIGKDLNEDFINNLFGI